MDALNWLHKHLDAEGSDWLRERLPVTSALWAGGARSGGGQPDMTARQRPAVLAGSRDAEAVLWLRPVDPLDSHEPEGRE